MHTYSERFERGQIALKRFRILSSSRPVLLCPPQSSFVRSENLHSGIGLPFLCIVKIVQKFIDINPAGFPVCCGSLTLIFEEGTFNGIKVNNFIRGNLQGYTDYE